MKHTILAIAATILVASPNVTFAQDAPPEEQLILPGEQEATQPDKKKRREKAEERTNQDADQPAQAEQDQAPEPTKKRKKKERVSGEGDDQPAQPEQAAPPEPVVEQPVQPAKKRKQKAEEQNGDQPEIEQGAAPEPTIEQPEKKKRKQKAEERKDQGGDQPAQAEQNPPQPTAEQPGTQPESAEIPLEAAEFLADKRISGDLSDAELKARISTGRALAKDERISRKQRQQALAMSKQATAELLRRQQQAQTEQPAEPDQPKPEEPAAEAEQLQPQPEKPKSEAEQQQAKELDGNKASPEAEAKAEEFLRGKGSAEQMNDEELRQRLDSMRALLGGNELSRESEQALRRQLRAEREILRSRVAEKVEVEEKAKQQKQQEEAADESGNQGKQGRDRGDKRRFDDWASDDVLRDRRSSDELAEGELRRRIDIYRDAVNDDRYDEGSRRYWRETMNRDRRTLRARMMNDRRDRADDYRRRRDSGDLDFNIDINIDLDEDRPESVFADEIDDEELEEQLAAAPRRKISRRYTVEEIEDDPEIRVAMPAIEIDTVRFGFNEAFVREEEVESLDRIAEVIEKILAAHPGEVFMIEGHTDAVGSNEYNLRLSRQRAQAVKEALTTFYVIPPRNLETVGYGERYLKIPTADPEQENRRVALRRVTPLVGEALED